MRTMNVRNNSQTQRRHIFMKIREYDFAITETALFLNTHPNNLKALNHYSKLRSERAKLVGEFEAAFGPITMYGNMSEKQWNWVDGPWPWEGEC